MREERMEKQIDGDGFCFALSREPDRSRYLYGLAGSGGGWVCCLPDSQRGECVYVGSGALLHSTRGFRSRARAHAHMMRVVRERILIVRN